MDTGNITSGEFYIGLCIDLIPVELESRDREIDSYWYISFLSDSTSCLISDISNDLSINTPHLSDTIE
jgi:hypothetical protein